MSCYEWENGTIKIPSKEWAGLKKSVRDKHNALQDALHTHAKKVHELLLAEGKGKRNFDFAGTLRKWGWDNHIALRGISCDDTWEITQVLFSHGKSKPRRPLKKDFPHMTNKDTYLSFEEAEIHFNNTTKVVTWQVAENNHSRDRAHDHPLGKHLFAGLSKIKWTRNSGGKLWGNDEYNQESCGAGGGNYVTQRFGHIGNKEERYY